MGVPGVPRGFNSCTPTSNDLGPSDIQRRWDLLAHPNEFDPDITPYLSGFEQVWTRPGSFQAPWRKEKGFSIPPEYTLAILEETIVPGRLTFPSGVPR